MEIANSTELEELRLRFQRFVADELRPLAATSGLDDGRQTATLSSGDVPQDLRRQVRRRAYELGFFAAGQPTEVGGGGLGAVAMCLLHETAAQSGDSLARFALGGTLGALLSCTEAQRPVYLDPVVRGDKTYAFALTEPTSGSRIAGLATTARRDGDAFVVNGVKSFVTHGDVADFIILVVEAAGDEKGGTTLLLVDRDTPGIRIARRFHTLDGGDAHCELIFEDCRVPVGNVLGAVGQGLPTGLGIITQNRLRISAGAVGTAQRALDMTIERVRGGPLAQREGVQSIVAEMAMDVVAGRALTYRAAAIADGGRQPAPLASADAAVAIAEAKVFATEMAGRVVDKALQLHGGAATIAGHPLERLYRSVRSLRLAEGATEVLKLFIGSRVIRG